MVLFFLSLPSTPDQVQCSMEDKDTTPPDEGHGAKVIIVSLSSRMWYMSNFRSYTMQLVGQISADRVYPGAYRFDCSSWNEQWTMPGLHSCIISVSAVDLSTNTVTCVRAILRVSSAHKTDTASDR